MYHLNTFKSAYNLAGIYIFNENYSQTKSLMKFLKIVMSNFIRLIIALPNQKKTTHNTKSIFQMLYIRESKLPGEARMTQGPTSSK